jgi:hypothetical protein
MPRVALLLVVALCACADETTLAGAPLGWGPASATLYSPPAASGGIVGDWLYCDDASCAARSSNGLRFAADGTMSDLWITNTEGTELVYCVSDPIGTYTWDGATLDIVDPGDGLTVACTVTLSGEIAALDCLQHQSYLRRISGKVEESCPIYYD